MRSAVAVVLLCLALGGCAQDSGSAGSSAGSEDPMVISQAVWNAYQRYLQFDNPGAFAVAADGRHAGASYCTEEACRHGFIEVGRTALVACGQFHAGDCRLFAEGTRIVLPYRVE